MLQRETVEEKAQRAIIIRRKEKEKGLLCERKKYSVRALDLHVFSSLRFS